MHTMKTFRSIIRIIFCFILITLLFGCEKKQQPEKSKPYISKFGMDGVYVNYLWKKDTIIIHNDSFHYGRNDTIPKSIDQDGSEFILGCCNDTSCAYDTSYTYIFHTEELNLIGNRIIGWRKKLDTSDFNLLYFSKITYKKK